MATFAEFLSSLDPETKGKQFEHFVKWFLQNDPEWKTQVDQIWLFDEYPDRWIREKGVDLFFKHKNGQIWAVQAKCYAPDYYITKGDVDKFLSESSRPGIDKRLLIATTDLIGPNAKEVCDNQEKPVTHFLYSDFDQAEIEYPEDITKLHSAKRKPRPTPRLHQEEAIDAVENGFKGSDRGQLIMACGTGKTFTTLWIKERLSAETTLVLLPSLSLLSQTLREWTFAGNTSFDVLCVCSDQTVGRRSGADEIMTSIHDVSFPVTSEVEEINEFLKRDGEKVVFSTYQSSPIIAECQQNNDISSFDLVIADEAHRCTGEVGSAFTTVLDGSLIRAEKRLFTTATPRTYSAHITRRAEERGVDVTGMDDESVFGKEFYALTFSQAIERDLLTDYQVVIIGVDKPMIAEWIENRELVKTDSGDVIDAESLASQIGLIKAIKDYDLKRMISFHSRVNRAESFASEVHDAVDFIHPKHRPDGEIWADFVSGAMPTHQRRLKLDQLKELTKGDRGLLSNARCLSEGVDVPSLDGVAFIDPKGSQVDIVQAVGRAIRLSHKKSVGTIVLPVFIEEDDSPEESIENSNFKPVWSVLNALKSHDEVLLFELDQLRTEMGRRGGGSIGGGISKVVFDLPRTVDSSFADSLTTYLVEQTTASWSFMYGLLEAYVEEEGHALVPSKYMREGRHRLGQWVGVQRTKKDQLTPEKITILEALKGWVWNTREFQWEKGFSYLEAYVEQEGHARVLYHYKAKDGYRLGVWVVNQRSRKDILTPEKIIRLESLAGWVWNTQELQWEEGFLYLKKYVEQEGHGKVPQDFIAGDEYKLGGWVRRQRASKDKLTPEQIIRLESLEGWVWNILEFQWEQGFSYLEAYVEQKGRAIVPMDYTTEDGYKLGIWVMTRRENKEQLTPDRITRLEALKGWVWNILEFQWEQGFSYLEAYVEQEGHARVSKNYITEDGYKLGEWVINLRSRKDKSTLDRITRLEALEGWIWEVLDFKWEQGFSYLEAYVEQKGHALVPAVYKSEDGYSLGAWVNGKRTYKHKLTSKQIARLESIDCWVWDVLEFQWEQGFSYLEAYVEQKGHALVPVVYKSEDGYSLGGWVCRQRASKDKLTPEQIIRLESLEGWVWNTLEFHWEQGFSYLEAYVEQEGHARVSNSYITEDGYRLRSWVNNQRTKKDQLAPEQIIRLESLEGWVWDASEFKWEKGFSYLEAYVEQEGHAIVSKAYITEDKYKLGNWIANLRRNKYRLTPEQIIRLESLEGWAWSSK